MLRPLGRFLTFLAAAVLALGAASAHAAVSVGDFIKFSDGPGSLGGGEFNINNLTHPTSPQDISFCLQTNEFIDFTHRFYVAGLETFASNEPDAPGGQDPLDAKTAYLFYHFVKGDLSSYNYGGTLAQRTASADALQNAIWKIEDESFKTPFAAQSTTWINEATTAIANGIWSGLGGVRVARLFYAKKNALGEWVPDYSRPAQDQLVYIPPPPGLPVPEPAAMFTWLMLGLTAGAARMVRKRRI